MAFDGITLALVKQEILSLGDGVRVDRIHQPSGDEIILSFRYRGGSRRYQLSASASTARIHSVKSTPENPMTPPMFCVLLRKHLASAKLVDIEQPGLDRVLHFRFEGANDIGDLTRPSLHLEIMGRYSNLILTDGEGRVIDALKRVDATMSSVRMVVPGCQYLPPKGQDKLSVLDYPAAELAERILSAPGATLAKCAGNTLQGISPIVARELEFRAAGSTDFSPAELTADGRARLEAAVGELADILNDKKEPYFNILYKEEGKPFDFSFLPITQYGTGVTSRRMDTLGEMVETFYRVKYEDQQARQRAGDLLQTASSALARVARRLDTQRLELKNSLDRETLRQYGDILSANLYAIKKGDTSFTGENFYTEPPQCVTIPLDPALDPVHNSQKYYAEYRKAATAEKKLRELIADGEKELTYLESVCDSLSRPMSAAELADVRDELYLGRYIRSSRGRQVKKEPSKPMEAVSSDGFRIAIGRNNRQNDRLTLKTAFSGDLWFHAKNMPGSHVVVFCRGTRPPDRTVEEAAMLAAYFSRGQQSSQVPVDCTQVRYVKKPAGAAPGMVIYTDYETFYVTPDADVVDRLTGKKQ